MIFPDFTDHDLSSTLRGLKITAKNNFLPNCLLFFTQNGYCLLQLLLERQMQFRRLGTQELYFLRLQQQTTANQW